jgi:hypothetical protein
MNYGHYQVSHRITDLPKDSKYNSMDWRWRVSGTNNDEGLELQRQFRMSLSNQRKDGGNEFWQTNINAAGYDDRVLRGNGILRQPWNMNLYWERFRPRKGRWELYGNFGANNGGIGEHRHWGWSASFNPTFYVTDSFSIYTNFSYEAIPQWVIWQHDNLLGTFKGEIGEFDAGVNWTIGDKQEFRVKLQALGVNAPLRQAWRAAGDGTPIATDDPVGDFSLSNFGFQIRYRYELKPLSDLYVVYARGGFREHDYADELGNLLPDAFSLRDDEQILVKLSYRFEK